MLEKKCYKLTMECKQIQQVLIFIRKTIYISPQYAPYLLLGNYNGDLSEYTYLCDEKLPSTPRLVIGSYILNIFQ